jgi:predicted nuclease with TOPRIM domain
MQRKRDRQEVDENKLLVEELQGEFRCSRHCRTPRPARALHFDACRCRRAKGTAKRLGEENSKLLGELDKRGQEVEDLKKHAEALGVKNTALWNVNKHNFSDPSSRELSVDPSVGEQQAHGMFDPAPSQSDVAGGTSKQHDPLLSFLMAGGAGVSQFIPSNSTLRSQQAA